jgi:hypothetical protein
VFAKLKLQNSNQNTNPIKYTFKEIVVKMQVQCLKHTHSKKLLLNETQMFKEETQPLRNANMQRANAK